MSPVTHFLTGWVLANTTGFRRRERGAVALACVAPDVDGLGVLPEVLTRHAARPLNWFSDYHHLLHNLPFALLVALAAFAVATRRWKTCLFALLAFHLHLLEDVLGSRGPANDYWSVPYLVPFSRWSWTWQGQWPLNSWQNVTLSVLLLTVTFWLAWKRGDSPLEMVSSTANAAFVDALRQRFPLQASS